MINANVCLDPNAGSNYGMPAQHIMDEHITAHLVGAPRLLPLRPRRVRAAILTPGRAWRSERRRCELTCAVKNLLLGQDGPVFQNEVHCSVT